MTQSHRIQSKELHVCIEAHREAVLAALRPDKDVTINEVRGAFAEMGLTFGFGTIQRFFERNGIAR